MQTVVYSRSFAGGVVAPEMLGRVDDVRVRTGLREARNMLPLAHGPATRRPGTGYLGSAKYSNKRGRLIAFDHPTDPVVIEVGEGYFRFWLNGELVATPAATAYVTNHPFPGGTAITGNIIDFAYSHGLTTGDAITFTEDTLAARLPAELLTSVHGLRKWYAIVVDPQRIRVATTKANALAGVAIPLLGGSLGTGGDPCRMHRWYAVGDLVLAGGVTYYCRVDRQFSLGAGPPRYTGAMSIGPGMDPAVWGAISATVYEVPNDYTESALADITSRRSNDVVSLAHPSYPLTVLARVANDHWESTIETFRPAVDTPQNVTASIGSRGKRYEVTGTVSSSPLRLTFARLAGLVSGDICYTDGVTYTGTSLPAGFYVLTNIDSNSADIRQVDGHGPTAVSGARTGSSFFSRVSPDQTAPVYYAVSAVDALGRESLPSEEVMVSSYLAPEGAFNLVSWTATPNAVKYRIYKRTTGVSAFCGESATTSFQDNNIDIDAAFPLPRLDTEAAARYPATVGYYEQRKVFARNQDVWATRTGTEADLTYALPVRDDDRLSFALAEAQQVRHVLGTPSGLVLLTNTAEYLVTAGDNGPLVPGSLYARQQSYVGASGVEPQLMGNVVLFATRRGGQVAEMAYRLQSGAAPAELVSVRAAHLFRGRTLTGSALAKAPHQAAWFVSSDGRLLYYSRIPEQEVAGWAWCDTGADAGDAVESATVLPGAVEDQLWLLVRRTVNGAVVRTIERMQPFAWSSLAAARYLDCAVTFAGHAGGTVSVPHLIGRPARVVADGVVYPVQVVPGSGLVTAPRAALVHVGLDYIAEMETPPLVAEVPGFAQGGVKNVRTVSVRVVDSAGFDVACNDGRLVPADAAQPSARGVLEADTVVSAVLNITPAGAWGEDGSVRCVQPLPLPLTVAAVTITATLGG